MVVRNWGREGCDDKGIAQGVFWGDRTVSYLDFGGGYTNLYRHEYSLNWSHKKSISLYPNFKNEIG